MTKIRDSINGLKEEIAEFTSSLIRIPTVNPPGKNYEKCTRIIGEKLTELGIDWNEIRVPEKRLTELALKGEGLPRPSIVGSFGKGEKELHFHGHYDVVPAIDDKQFQPHISKGRLYGRGAADMKGGLAVILFALQALKECDVSLNGTVSFSITPDEETGGLAGLKYLLDEGYISRNLIGVMDPEPSSGDIINGSRGALSFDVIVKGRASHVMTDSLGVNAFENMVEVADAFLELKKQVEQRKTRHPVTPPGSDHSILLVGGVCGGGTNFNIVPDTVYFTVDRRFNLEENPTEVQREIHEVIAALQEKGLEIETRIFQQGNASFTSQEEPICTTLMKVVEQVTGHRPDVSICPGLLETRFFVELGIPAVIYGPGLLEEAHGPNESVQVDNVIDCTRIYASTALKLLGQ